MSGYRFDIRKVEGETNRYRVKAQLKNHYYDETRTNRTGPAPHNYRKYEYYLDTNDEGVITGGEWISNNPDFLWVPLSQKKCGRENPNIDHSWVQKIIETLPSINKGGENE